MFSGVLFCSTFLKWKSKNKNLEEGFPIKELQINEEITDKNIKIISAEGGQLGIFTLEEALNMADEKGLDLVKVASTNEFGVCKFMDYSKYRFEQQKKLKEMKKNQKVVEMKEIKFSVSTQTNDLEIRKKQAIKFLQKGNKLKIVCKMEDREKNFTKIALEKASKFAEALVPYGIIEKPASISNSRRRRELLAVIFMGPLKK